MRDEKELLEMFFALLDLNFYEDVTCYGVSDPESGHFMPFFYKTAYTHPKFKKVLVLDTGGPRFISKSDLNNLIKTGHFQETIIEPIVSNWSDCGLFEYRDWERKIIAKLKWPSKQEIETYTEDECWSCDPNINLIGRNYDELPPQRPV